MTKPVAIMLGIGTAGALSAAGAVASAREGAALASALLAWSALGCLCVSAAYALNRPGVYGKRDGGIPAWRILVLGPFLLAFWSAWGLRSLFRPRPYYHLVSPGLWVGARVSATGLPPGVEVVVDLTSELWAPRSIRRMPGYYNFPVLDGFHPRDEDAFLDLVTEVAAAPGGIYVHCESGKGRAPTLAALLLLARGVVDSPEAALELVRKRRPTAAPGRRDVAFVRRLAPRLC